MYGGTGGISGTHNLALGTQSMRAAKGITGNNNIGLGLFAMTAAGKITGTDNIAIGQSTLNTTSNNDISGSYNIGIGNHALYEDMVKGNANIHIGNNTVGTPVLGELNKVVAIGNEIVGLSTTTTYSNVILLGNNHGGDAPKIGMGTYKPQAKLDVNGDIRVGNENKSCTSANEGSIRYVSASKKFQGCDGSNWINLN